MLILATKILTASEKTEVKQRKENFSQNLLKLGTGSRRRRSGPGKSSGEYEMTEFKRH